MILQVISKILFVISGGILPSGQLGPLWEKIAGHRWQVLVIAYRAKLLNWLQVPFEYVGEAWETPPMPRFEEGRFLPTISSNLWWQQLFHIFCSKTILDGTVWHIFQMGWNYQLVIDVYRRFHFYLGSLCIVSGAQGLCISTTKTQQQKTGEKWKVWPHGNVSQGISPKNKRFGDKGIDVLHKSMIWGHLRCCFRSCCFMVGHLLLEFGCLVRCSFTRRPALLGLYRRHRCWPLLEPWRMFFWPTPKAPCWQIWICSQYLWSSIDGPKTWKPLGFLKGNKVIDTDRLGEVFGMKQRWTNDNTDKFHKLEKEMFYGFSLVLFEGLGALNFQTRWCFRKNLWIYSNLEFGEACTPEN